jgi:hypothetical protein
MIRAYPPAVVTLTSPLTGSTAIAGAAAKHTAIRPTARRQTHRAPSRAHRSPDRARASRPLVLEVFAWPTMSMLRGSRARAEYRQPAGRLRQSRAWRLMSRYQVDVFCDDLRCPPSSMVPWFFNGLRKSVAGLRSAPPRPSSWLRPTLRQTIGPLRCRRLEATGPDSGTFSIQGRGCRSAPTARRAVPVDRSGLNRRRVRSPRRHRWSSTSTNEKANAQVVY